MNRIEKWIHNKLNNKAEKENYSWVSIKTDDEKRMSNKLISQYDWEKIQDKIKTQKNEILRLNSIINELNWKIKELDDMFYETFRISQNGYYSISEWELKDFTNKLQELQAINKQVEELRWNKIGE